MLRKHILNIDKRKLRQDAPFYAWDCITLQVKGRPDIYLVIKNEKIMSMFIKLLIFKLKTVDGTRGSMVRIINQVMKKNLKDNPNMSY